MHWVNPAIWSNAARVQPERNHICSQSSMAVGQTAKEALVEQHGAARTWLMMLLQIVQ